jgi:hypothetical protein
VSNDPQEAVVGRGALAQASEVDASVGDADEAGAVQAPDLGVFEQAAPVKPESTTPSKAILQRVTGWL